MRKLFTLFAFAGVFAFVACGPGAGELEKAKRAKEDSIRVADSLATAELAAREQLKVDSLAKANAEKAKMDSTRIADSVAAAAKAEPKGKKKK